MHLFPILTYSGIWTSTNRKCENWYVQAEQVEKKPQLK